MYAEVDAAVHYITSLLFPHGGHRVSEDALPDHHHPTIVNAFSMQLRSLLAIRFKLHLMTNFGPEWNTPGRPRQPATIMNNPNKPFEVSVRLGPNGDTGALDLDIIRAATHSGALLPKVIVPPIQLVILYKGMVIGTEANQEIHEIFRSNY